MNKKKNWR